MDLNQNTLATLPKAQSATYLLDVGGGDGSRARELYPNSHVEVIDLNMGWDITVSGLPYGNWDVILCNHIIEHLINPDFLLEKCKEVMSENTIIDIGTPNLTAWFNRILFIAGYVPHSMELSTQVNVGKPFNWSNEPLGGHIRIFTVQALLDLLKHHGFKILSVVGEPSNYPCNKVIRSIDRFFTAVRPSFAGMFRVKCKK
jgi:hypothetical protein